MKKAMYAMLVAGLMSVMAACGASDNGTVALKDSSSGDATSGDSKPLTDESADATDDTYEPCDGSEYGAQKFFCRVAGTYTGVATNKPTGADPTGFVKTMPDGICTTGSTYQFTISNTGTINITTDSTPIVETFGENFFDSYHGPDTALYADSATILLYRTVGSSIFSIRLDEQHAAKSSYVTPAEMAADAVKTLSAQIGLDGFYVPACNYELTKQ